MPDSGSCLIGSSSTSKVGVSRRGGSNASAGWNFAEVVLDEMDRPRGRTSSALRDPTELEKLGRRIVTRSRGKSISDATGVIVTEMSPSVESLASFDLGRLPGDLASTRGICAASLAIKVDDVDKRRGRRLGLDGAAAGRFASALMDLELGCVLRVGGRVGWLAGFGLFDAAGAVSDLVAG